MTDVGPFIGIDLGGTNMGASLVSGDNQVLASARARTEADGGPDAVLKRIADLVGTVMEQAGVKRGDVGGAGIGAPGALDIRRGIVLNAVNLRWRDMPLADELGKVLGMPVVVDNDVNVGTWGEHQLGAGRGYDDLMGIFVGTGIGGGLVLNGRLYHGGMQTAGEIGHTVLIADAPLGRRTLENLASRTNVVHQLAQLVRANHPTSLPQLADGTFDRDRAAEIAAALEQGDELVTEVVTAAADYVGTAIANAVTLLSLSCVVVGGGLTESLGEPWMKLVRAAFNRHVFPHELRACHLVACGLDDKAGPVGAALLARRQLAAVVA